MWRAIRPELSVPCLLQRQLPHTFLYRAGRSSRKTRASVGLPPTAQCLQIRRSTSISPGTSVAPVTDSSWRPVRQPTHRLVRNPHGGVSCRSQHASADFGRQPAPAARQDERKALNQCEIGTQKVWHERCFYQPKQRSTQSSRYASQQEQERKGGALNENASAIGKTRVRMQPGQKPTGQLRHASVADRWRTSRL